ncbi:MAG TPA: hypothetical protein RMH99_02185, partial [Sandaracinaceae bacterium LLY-WYZ-13_1]|nr:hypothetical protein [Sandaracinaceae bacterium LLY-WYZ-13_1]
MRALVISLAVLVVALPTAVSAQDAGSSPGGAAEADDAVDGHETGGSESGTTTTDDGGAATDDGAAATDDGAAATDDGAAATDDGAAATD